MKKIGILLLALAGLLMIGITASRKPQPFDHTAAIYKTHTVTMNMIESHRNTPAFTDREIIDAILKNVMLEEEAQNRGIHVTEKDVEAFLASTVYASYEMEEGKASIDAYCEDAGLTFDEYVASVREAAPSIIRKAKLERDIAETYCKEHSLVFDERNPSQEIRDAVKEEENAIFEAHKHEIQYFVK